jgi:serine/threonine-protein kinase
VSRFNPGELVSGKYRIIRLIGDGGMGVVYEARHEVLGSSVALKFLHAELAKRPGLTQRFLQEARVSATIQSPHVTHVTDVDTAQDGSPYLVMELLSGQSLQGMLDRQGKLPQDQVVDFGLQILAGLEAAHATGVVHRDMKPDNVFVTPSAGGPVLKLIDFGIAKLRVSTEYGKGLTRAGVVMGTPEYMAPEQLVSAHTTDHRADIYSVGVMLFEMLAGLRPTDGDDAELIIAAVEAGRVRKLADVAPDAPPGLVHLIEQAMLPSRDARFDSAAQMRLALASFAGQLSHAGRLAATAEPLPPLATPAASALLSLPPHVVSAAPSPMPPAVPKTLPPDGPPLSVSQLGAARTSLSEGEPVMSQLPRPQVPATAPAAPVMYPQSYAPPPVVRSRGRGVLVASLALAVLGGGGAVGYAAYRAADHDRNRPPPLPILTSPSTLEPLETPSPTAPNPPTVTPTASPTPGPRPAGPGPKPPSAGSGGAPAAGTAGAGAGGQTSLPPFQLPFPIPSQIQIPPLPSSIQLPPGFPSSFPPGFPGFPAPPGAGGAPANKAAPAAPSK